MKIDLLLFLINYYSVFCIHTYRFSPLQCIYANTQLASFIQTLVSQELSQSKIFCILQESNTLVWIGTTTGFNIYHPFITILEPIDRMGMINGAGHLFLIAALVFSWCHFYRSQLKQDRLLKQERAEKERIEKLNQIKLRFFTNAVHEFRTPLSLISGPLQHVIQSGVDSPNQNEHLHVIQRHVDRLLGLVNELMDFRKIDADTIHISVRKTSLVCIISDAILCFEATMNDRNINIEMDVNMSGSYNGFVDRRVLDKILFNLLSNALKHTTDGDKIVVKLSDFEGFARIDVTDTGRGIAKHELEHIFEQFYQVEDTNTMFGGYGIGLAHAKCLIEAHRGTISVSSKLQYGSTFTIQFPIDYTSYSHEQVGVEQLNSEIDIAKGTSDDYCYESELLKAHIETKLLIVEDDHDLRDFLAQIYSHFQVYTAENGRRGLEIATKEIPDLIISDILMPEMDGLDLCYRLKNDFLTSHIPVLFLSARTTEEQQIEGLQIGADAYLGKPFNIDLLNATVNGLLEKQRRLKHIFSEEGTSPPQATNVHDQRFIDEVYKAIHNNLSNPHFSLDVLAVQLGMSRSKLYRKFNALFDLSPSETLRVERLKFAKELMAKGEYNITEISDMSGFSSSSYFITTFKKHFKTTPLEYMRNPS